jgi:hypothetical protein
VLKLDTDATDVHVFRADTDHEGVYPLRGFIHVPEDEVGKWQWSSSSLLSELPITEDGLLPSQGKLSLAYGFFVPILVVNAALHKSQSLSVRLYRPGYELIEVRPWQRAGEINWLPAVDFKAQEDTLDRLMKGIPLVGPASHRESLRFVAAEYERLAAATDCPEQRTRLAAKGDQIRKSAENENW